MKSPIKILVAAFLISMAGFQSCTKEDKADIVYNVASNYLNHGSWKVTRFEEDGTNKLDLFHGYVFQFKTDGTVTATKANNVVKGNWSTTSSGSATKLNLSFGSAPFNEMNEDWIIKSGGTGSIQLEHQSGGNGSIDYLNFEKI